MTFLVSYLLYPGLALALLLGLIWQIGFEGRRRISARPSLAVLRSVDGVAGLLSVLLAAGALALLPWPLHPASGASWIASPLLLWMTLEGAFLVVALPGWLAPTFAGRATAREVQIGVAGRVVLWLVIGSGLWLAANTTPVALGGRALLAMAGLLAFPVAAGVGPFAAERSLNAGGAEEGLDESTASLLRFARSLRAAVLLAAILVTLLRGVGGMLALALIALLFVAVMLVLRWVVAGLPRLTLLGALRWCWWRALPVAVLGVLALAL